MMGIDRKSIIKTVYGDLAGNTKPLDSLVYYPVRRVVQAGLREVELQPDEGARAAEEALHGRPVVAVRRQLGDLDLLGPAGEVPLHVDGVERDAHDAGGHHQGAAQGRSASSRRRCAPGERRLRPDGHPVRRTTTSRTSRGSRSPIRPASSRPGAAAGARTTSITATGRRRRPSKQARTASSIRRSALRSSNRPTRSCRTTSRRSRCTRAPTRSSSSRGSAA